MPAAMVGATLLAVAAPGWLLPARPLAAQVWSAEATAGRILPDGGVFRAGSSAALSLSRLGVDARTRLSAGIPLATDDPFWGAASVWKRLRLTGGPLEVGLDLSGDALVQEDRARVGPVPGGDVVGGLLGRRPLPEGEPLSGWTASAAVLPRLGVALGPFDLGVRLGVAGHASDLAGSHLERGLRQADARIGWAPRPGRSLAVELARIEVAEGGWSRVALSGGEVRGSFAVQGEWARWLGEGGPVGSEWTLAGRLALSPTWALVAAARRVGLDPLRLTPSHTAWSVGLQLGFGAPRPPAAPVPASYTEGRAVITVAARDAGPAPRIAGDFNGWVPEPMVRVSDEWRHAVTLEPGVYHFSLVGPDGSWFVPASIPGRREDGFGGHVAVLVVAESDG